MMRNRRQTTPSHKVHHHRRDITEMSDRHSPRYLSRPVWVAAGLGALAIHAGCVALALAAMRPDEPADDLGAPAIEIGVELMSPRLDPTDLPVGPDTEASAPSPAIVEQKTVVEQTELPKAVPTDTDDPDRVVAPASPTKPKDEHPRTATIQADPSEQSVATLATATPTVERAPPSPLSVAPSPGAGDSARLERVTWEKQLAAHFDKYKRYPPDRVMRSAEVVVSFVLDRVGHVLSARIVKGSGDASFDDAALAMLQRSDPVPPPPPVVADEGLTFTLPVVFYVKPQK
jgi:TonB family protein